MGTECLPFTTIEKLWDSFCCLLSYKTSLSFLITRRKPVKTYLTKGSDFISRQYQMSIQQTGMFHHGPIPPPPAVARPTKKFTHGAKLSKNSY